LEKQRNDHYETILVDNRESQFGSAAKALNSGAERASGEYYMFVHQDVELLSDDWLETAYEHIEPIGNLGIAGVAGLSAVGSTRDERGRNVIYHGEQKQRWPMSNEITAPEAVRTLDELLLIIPAQVFAQHKFNENLCDGWHLYGVEYAIRLDNRTRWRPYVLPLPVYHASTGAGWDRVAYFSTLLRIVREYDNLKTVPTTTEDWPADEKYVKNKLYTNILRSRSPPLPTPVKSVAKKILSRSSRFDF